MSLPARFEVLDINNKSIVFDVAHNSASMNALTKNLNMVYPNKKVLIVLGIYADKDNKCNC